jgi:hypothetical protein
MSRAWGIPLACYYDFVERQKVVRPICRIVVLKKAALEAAFFNRNKIWSEPVIPTLALSKSGYRSKVAPSSQPVTQAPVCILFLLFVFLFYSFTVGSFFF